MDKFLQIATQELGQKEISGDQDNQVSTSVYHINTVLGFRRISPSQLLNLPEPTLERRDQGGNSDTEKNPPLTSAISNMKRSETTWIQLVFRHGIINLGPKANLLESKNLIESEKACNDVKINSD